MKAKDYMRRIQIMNIKINNKLKELDDLRTMAISITSVVGGDRVQSSGNPDKMADSVVKIIDLENEIQESIDGLINIKRATMEKVDAIENHDYIDVLYKRYFQYKTWEQISVEMGYSYQWVNVLHGRALNVLDNILKKEKICNT